MGDFGDRFKGYGRPASLLMLSYAFNDLGLKKLQSYQLSDNSAPINIAKKFGFKVEGTLRNYIFKNGAWKDVTVCGITAEEFFQNRAEADARRHEPAAVQRLASKAAKAASLQV